MKLVILKVVILIIVMFSLVSLIPLLPNEFYKALTVFILFHILIAGMVTIHLKRTNSLRIYGMYLTAIALIYGYANYTVSGLLSYAATRGVVSGQSALLILSLVTLLSMGIYAIVKGGPLFPVSKIIIVSLLLLLAYLVTELPLYHHSHYSHGHSLWRGGHLH